MLKRTSPLFGAAVLLVDVGAVSSLFAVFLLVETGRLMFPALPLWCAGLLLCYGALCLLLRKPRTVRLLMVVCLVCFLAQAGLAFWLYGLFAGTTGLLFSLGAWAATYFHAYNLALKPPAAEKLMTAFEVSVLAGLFSLFYCSVRHMAYTAVLPAALAALVALAGLIARRTASGRDKAGAPRGAGTVLGVLLAFGLGALLLAGAAAGAVKTLALGLWSAVKAVAGFLGRCANALLEWLMERIPEGDPGELPAEPPAAVLPEGAEPMEQLVDHTMVLYALLGLVVLAVLAVLVWMLLRGGKLRRRAAVGGGRVTRRRTGPGQALRRWLGRLRQQLFFHIHRILLRDTAPGLFVWLERRNALRRKGRRVSETCQEYLLRLALEDLRHATILHTLANDLDEHYFGSGSRLSRREIRAMRKALSK